MFYQNPFSNVEVEDSSKCISSPFLFFFTKGHNSAKNVWIARKTLTICTRTLNKKAFLKVLSKSKEKCRNFAWNYERPQADIHQSNIRQPGEKSNICNTEFNERDHHMTSDFESLMIHLWFTAVPGRLYSFMWGRYKNASGSTHVLAPVWGHPPP